MGAYLGTRSKKGPRWGEWKHTMIVIYNSANNGAAGLRVPQVVWETLQAEAYTRL